MPSDVEKLISQPAITLCSSTEPPPQWLPGWLPSKESACPCRSCRRCGFDPWVDTTPWRKAWRPTPLLLSGKSHGQRVLVGYSLYCPKEWNVAEHTGKHKIPVSLTFNPLVERELQRWFSCPESKLITRAPQLRKFYPPKSFQFDLTLALFLEILENVLSPLICFSRASNTDPPVLSSEEKILLAETPSKGCCFYYIPLIYRYCTRINEE